MSYYNNYLPQTSHLESKIKQLETDKINLSSAIEDLNSCYQEKILLLQNNIVQQQEKYEELLEWKQAHIDKSLFDVQRYDLQIKKMIEILDTAHKNFEIEKESLVNEIRDQSQEIRYLRQENQALNQFNHQNQNRIEEMVHTYTEEIEKLKQELRYLKEESIVSEDSSILALRQITNRNNETIEEPNQKPMQFIGAGDPVLSKISIETVME